MSTRPDNSVAVDFLRRWTSEGPWLLTAIQLDRKRTYTETFYPETSGQLEQWLLRHNGTNNIYFSVNPPTRDTQKKAVREDIRELAWLHVDIDPRAGERVEEEQARALGLLTTDLPEGVPAPTVIVFSGGGYQGFWRLAEPLEIGGDLEKAEQAKLFNVQLEILFGADNCHNIDRVMRLPGTVNIPDARKRKKGRQEVVAELVEFNDNSYPLSMFKPAPELQSGAAPLRGTGITVDVPSDIERVDDVSELDTWDVPDRVKVIMVQGRHPDLPKDGDNSRSAWLFDFCCQMIRCGVPDETLFAIITDPEWGISESVVEHKANATKYAIRQIQRAKEHAIDPWLSYFNDRYWVVSKIGGKCMVLTESYDDVLKRNRLVMMSLQSFEQAYENKQVKVGENDKGAPIFKPAGKFWRYHPNRRQYDRITFAPGMQMPPDVYNLWRGFAVQSVPGDCQMYLDHVRDIICAGNEGHYRYLLGWMARAVQHPAGAGEVAVVLRGMRGTGKGVFAKTFGRLFGHHYMQVTNPSHLVGNFNKHLRDLVVLFADEAFYAGDKKHESILKGIVTEETITIELKGVDAEPEPNNIHLIMASNDAHVVPAGRDERRYFVLDVSPEHRRDTAYFKELNQRMNNGGLEALLHYLLDHDLSEYEVRDVPMTEALREQKLLSMDPDEEWWFQKLVRAQLLYNDDAWPGEVMVREIVDDYVDHARRHHLTRRSTETKLGRFLNSVLPYVKRYRKVTQVDVMTHDGFLIKKSMRALFYKVPPLDLCRERWQELHGPVDWPEDEDFDNPELSY